MCPIFGQPFLTGVDPGSMTYSAVTQPPGRSSLNHAGTSAVIHAVHNTIVFPCSHNTDPAGVCVKPRVTLIFLNSCSAR